MTSPIPVVEPVTSPIPVIGDRPGADPRPDAGRARQAFVLTALVALVLLSGLLLATGRHLSGSSTPASAGRPVRTARPSQRHARRASSTSNRSSRIGRPRTCSARATR